MNLRQIRDWRERTIEAEERLAWPGSYEGFTQADRRDAGGWAGCAVGEYFRRASKKVKLMIGHPEEFVYMGPEDRVLARLGGSFFEYVNEDNFLAVYKTIDLIEARVYEIRAQKATAA